MAGSVIRARSDDQAVRAWVGCSFMGPSGPAAPGRPGTAPTGASPPGAPARLPSHALHYACHAVPALRCQFSRRGAGWHRQVGKLRLGNQARIIIECGHKITPRLHTDSEHGIRLWADICGRKNTPTRGENPRLVPLRILAFVRFSARGDCPQTYPMS